MLRIASVVAMCVIGVLGEAAAGDMQKPRITRAEVDQEGAAAALGDIAPLRTLHASADTAAPSSEVTRLNAATAERLPGVERSPIPVLLPFDIEAYLRDRSAGELRDDDSYYFGFGRAPFFHAGPAGYDAAFRFVPSSIPDLADVRYGDAADILISGSILTYELDPPVAETGAGVPALDADYPGIRRLLLEDQVRYSFVRFGVPYVVSTACFDGPVARFRHMACHDADKVIVRFIKSLRIAGGLARTAPAAEAPRARPAKNAPAFTFHGPGLLLPGTGFRHNGGRPDTTVYGDILFPLAQAPAFAGTQYFNRGSAGGRAAYPWRDNFCESRAFHVVQCPGGMGHQGQDIRAAACNPHSAGGDRCKPHQHDVVAVHAGMILRAPRQEAVYLVVNTPTEHIRFRYLHMRPTLLDADGVVSGREVMAGEVIGQIGNYSQSENGTSYHLHFDVQVLTTSGWVFVNPYMTLVAAYEHLIGGRGEEIVQDVMASATTSDEGPHVMTLATIRHAILAPADETLSSGADPVPGRQPNVAAAPCGARPSRGRPWRGCGAGYAGAHGARHRHGSRIARRFRRHHDW